LIAPGDVHTWWLLAHDVGLSRPDIRRTLVEALERLLDDGSATR
jgi:hypothetical protein